MPLHSQHHLFPSSNTAATLLVLGCGPGVGLAAAKALAKTGKFVHVVLVSRNEERLKGEAQQVEDAAGKDVNLKVHTIATDLSDFNSLRQTLATVQAFGRLECVLFNAARIKPGKPLETSVEEMEEDFKTSTLALYVTAQQLVPALQKNSTTSSKPAFIVTNSHLPEDPAPEVLSLSVVKAAQQNMMQSFDAAFGDDVQFAVIKIKGTVGTEKDHIHPETIAQKITEVYQRASINQKGDLLLGIDP